VRDRAGRRAGLDAGEEEFAALDPALRRLRGVYATPQPVVAWVVRSIDELLRSRFEKPRGLADEAVRLLDPCAGPMNFLLEAWRVAVAQGDRHDLEPASLVESHLLPHSRGIEIVPELFERGRAEVAIWLARYGVRVGEGGRFPLDLADALSDVELGDEAWPGFLGGAGHPTSPALPVVLGNPPYRGQSANRGARIRQLLHGYRLADGREDEGYYRVDGHGLGERNPKWLQDDAVKFLRLAQWTVDRAGQGLVAFVLNHNFIDAPTFRGLRASLQRTFDEIYALDLHGNRRKRERQSGGSPDENVFRGVAQGVAILLLVKRSGLARHMLRADLYGDRQAKLGALADGSVSSTVWTEVCPRSPSYLFVVGEASRERRYRDGVALPEIFSVSTTGIITGRDAVLTDLDRGRLEERLAAPENAGGGQPRRGRACDAASGRRMAAPYRAAPRPPFRHAPGDLRGVRPRPSTASGDGMDAPGRQPRPRRCSSVQGGPRRPGRRLAGRAQGGLRLRR
jgi:hypothetical protein